jgi:hypothetical protein
MHWVLVNSDLIGGLLGIFGSLVLGYPFITEMTDRHHWDLLRRFKQQQMPTSGSTRSASAQEIEAYREIRDRLIDQPLGDYLRYRRITVCGILLLLAAFVFMTAASYDRSWSSASMKQPETPGTGSIPQ